MTPLTIGAPRMTENTALFVHVFSHPDRLPNGALRYSGEDVQTNYHDAMEYLDGFMPAFTNHGCEYITTLIREPKSGVGETGFTYREAYLVDELEDWKQQCHSEAMADLRARDWHLSRVL